MTKKELINLLSKYPDDTIIIVYHEELYYISTGITEYKTDKTIGQYNNININSDITDKSETCIMII